MTGGLATHPLASHSNLRAFRFSTFYGCQNVAELFYYLHVHLNVLSLRLQLPFY